MAQRAKPVLDGRMGAADRAAAVRGAFDLCAAGGCQSGSAIPRAKRMARRNHAGRRRTRVAAVQYRGGADDHPQGERRADSAREHPMLAQPSTHTAPIAESTHHAPTRISAAPAGAATPGEHFLDMHHEVLVRELALAKLAREFVLERASWRVELRWPSRPTAERRPAQARADSPLASGTKGGGSTGAGKR